MQNLEELEHKVELFKGKKRKRRRHPVTLGTMTLPRTEATASWRVVVGVDVPGGGNHRGPSEARADDPVALGSL